jgi:hypothetical protein
MDRCCGGIDWKRLSTVTFPVTRHAKLRVDSEVSADCTESRTMKNVRTTAQYFICASGTFSVYVNKLVIIYCFRLYPVLTNRSHG